MRTKFTLACQECKQHNYLGDRNKTQQPERLEVKKFCKFCNKQTMHKELKKR